MVLSDHQPISAETQSSHRERGCPGRNSSATFSNTSRSSSHVPQSESVHLHPINTGYDGEDMVGDSDDGCDSDSTLDLDEATLSPLLRNTPPLQRMSRDHERVILSSLSRGRVVTYSCVCSRGMQNCVFNNERKVDELMGSSEEEGSDDDWTEEGVKSSFRPLRQYTFPGWIVTTATKDIQDTAKMVREVDTNHAQLSVESDTDIGVALK